MIKLQKILLCTLLIFIASCNGAESEETLSENQGTTINKALWNDGDLPLAVVVSGQLDAGEVSAVSDSLNTWDNAFSGVNFFDSSLDFTTDPKHSSLEAYRDQSDIFGVYSVESGDPLADPSLDDAKALAVTQFYAFVKELNGEKYYRIIHADIFVNKRLYEFTNDSNDDTKYDFSSVILHEMGHLLGLGHVSFGQGQSVMNPSISTATSKRSLFSIDEQNIADNYQTGASSAKAQSQKSSAAVRVLTTLMPNGDCHHYENDKLVHSHHSDHDLH